MEASLVPTAHVSIAWQDVAGGGHGIPELLLHRDLSRQAIAHGLSIWVPFDKFVPKKC